MIYLGKPLSTHTIRRRAVFVRMIAGTLFTLLSIWLNSLSLEMILSGRPVNALYLIGFGFFALCLGFGFWLIGSVFWKLWQNPVLTIYDGGVQLKTRGKEQSWRWTELSKIQGQITAFHIEIFYTGITYGAYLVYAGKKVAFAIDYAYQNVDLLVNLITMNIPKQMMEQRL